MRAVLTCRVTTPGPQRGCAEHVHICDVPAVPSRVRVDGGACLLVALVAEVHFEAEDCTLVTRVGQIVLKRRCQRVHHSLARAGRERLDWATDKHAWPRAQRSERVKRVAHLLGYGTSIPAPLGWGWARQDYEAAASCVGEEW